MRCHACGRLSFSLICPDCQKSYLYPEPKIRTLDTGLKVLSFFAYDEIEPFLLTKHTPHGWFVYRLLAKWAFERLEKREEKRFAVAVDDDVQRGYSHTALIARALVPYGYRNLPGALLARNRVSYAGQPLNFRLQNPRNFIYHGPAGVSVVLVDDIVTSGLTLQEAHGVLLRGGVEVENAIVLADANR